MELNKEKRNISKFFLQSKRTSCKGTYENPEPKTWLVDCTDPLLVNPQISHVLFWAQSSLSQSQLRKW